MEKEMQEQVAGILEQFSDGLTELGKVKDFAVAELPDVVQQLFVWKTVESLIYNAITIITCIGIAILTKRIFSFLKRESGDEEDKWIAAGILSIINCIVFLVGTNLTWLQIWITPMFYLIEYAKSLM